MIAYPSTSPQSARTEAIVHTLRNRTIPAATAGTGVVAYVGGETAGSVDASSYLSSRLVWVIGVVLLLAFLLLMAVFRSVAIPVKAVVVNMLSVGAAYGVIVAVFQWGWLGGVIGIGSTGPIDPWIPLMMFTILFGLSMDYEVFLLSRIREEWRRTGDNSSAVADGLAKTARVITAAAAIMICVFGSFVIGDPLHVLKVFGLGLAAAILIDATLVRMVLVPSIMELLGTGQLVDAVLAGPHRPQPGGRGGRGRTPPRSGQRPGGVTSPSCQLVLARSRSPRPPSAYSPPWRASGGSPCGPGASTGVISSRRSVETTAPPVPRPADGADRADR